MNVPDISALPPRPEALHVIMSSPEYFKIVDEKNVHMKGNLGNTNQEKAMQQWEHLRKIYEQELGLGNLDSISIIKGAKDCEDMVFCANQSFPWIDNNSQPVVVMSRMKHASRQREVPSFREFYASKGYTIFDAPGTACLEGMGDLIPMPGKRLIFGGYGHRTDLSTLEEMQALLKTPVVSLRLVSDSFYHLDTCFIPLHTDTVLLVPSAFDTEGLEKIRACFKEVIEIPEEEAARGFALNAHIVNGHTRKFAVIQQGNAFTTQVLTSKGYQVYEMDTSEYMKSGGSVFCMKMMSY